MLRTLSNLLLLGISLSAQTTTTVTAPNIFNDSELSRYPKFGSKDYFRTIFRKETTKFELQGPIKLQDYVTAQKLQLSLKAFLELAMNNNTDVQIQRLVLEIPKTAITRSYSIFDPQFVGRFSSTRSKTATTDALAGAETLSSLSQPLTLNWQQTAPTGTQYSINYSASKNSTNSAFANVNPAYASNLNLSFNQPLVRGRSLQVVRAPITLAKSRLKVSVFGFQDQLLGLLTNAENSYWDVISAREILKVQESALALADASLKRAQRELELGALPALEIFQPQAVYARSEILVTQARYRLLQAEDALRRQMGIDLDPELRKLQIELTESVLPPTDNAPFDKESLVDSALKLRPDLMGQRTFLEIDDLNLRVTRDSLKPDLSLFGNYSIQGRGGPTFIRQPGVNTVIPGGFPDAFDQMWGFGFPITGGGIQLRLPIKDRNASANYTDAVVSKRLDLLRIRTLEQNVRLEVLNAINQVENSRASVELAKIAADLAQKRVDADQKRYDLGTITLFFLLDSQNALNLAQSDLVAQSVQYRRNQLTLYRRLGTLLTERGITTN